MSQIPGWGDNTIAVTNNGDLPAPTALSATNVKAGSFQANWEQELGAEYRLDLSTASDFSSFVDGFQDLDVGETSSYFIEALDEGTTYYYRVRAINFQGITSDSNIINTTTSAAGTPDAPIALEVVSFASTFFYAKWEFSDDGVDYFLDVSTSSDFSSFVSGFNNLNVGQVNSHKVDGLSNSTTYYYRVRTDNSIGTSNNSNTINITTETTMLDISGLSLWLDGADEKTLYDSHTGGSLVTADGSIARWEDKSENGRHARQSTNSDRPIRKTSVQNGKDIVLFDGTDDMMNLDSQPIVGTSPRTFFCVFELDAFPDPNTGALFEATVNPDLIDGGSYAICPENGQIALRYRGNDLYEPGLSLSTWGLLRVAWVSGSSDTTVVYIDGVQHTWSSSSVPRTLDTLEGTASIGFSTVNNNDYFQGKMAEMIIFDRDLTTTEREDVEEYLQAKWNVPQSTEFTSGTAITESGWYDVPDGVNSMDALVVAGGGGGGAGWGGGGGAGGLVFQQNITVTPGERIFVGVGQGGAGGVETASAAMNGGNSYFKSITAIGGGGGQSDEGPSEGADGGSGGGGRIRASNPGGLGASGQGNDGGDATSDTGSDRGSGGGGGAGAVGQQGSDVGNGEGGDGGTGLDYSTEFGTSVGDSGWFAGGGGGSGNDAAGVGGQGGGGAGKITSETTGDAGVANTGGGGGGGGGTVGNRDGGNGGSGVVIVKYN